MISVGVLKGFSPFNDKMSRFIVKNQILPQEMPSSIKLFGTMGGNV